MMTRSPGGRGRVSDRGLMTATGRVGTVRTVLIADLVLDRWRKLPPLVADAALAAVLAVVTVMSIHVDDRNDASETMTAWAWGLLAVQFAALSTGLALTYLDYSDLDTLTRKGLARTNRTSGGRLVSDYRILDLNGGLAFELAGQPLRLGFDLAHNFGADDQADAARGELVWGDSDQRGAWELGYAYQRIQRDAAMAAFNSDDWWFHSWVRGFGVWAGYGLGDHWSLRLTGFRERRDGQSQHVARGLLDLVANW